MRYALLGALLIVGGIAARIEASRHAPNYSMFAPGQNFCINPCLRSYNLGWPQTTYDLVRLGGWALLVFGAVIVAFALVRELRR